jgi:hypothetical protein
VRGAGVHHLPSANALIGAVGLRRSPMTPHDLDQPLNKKPPRRTGAASVSIEKVTERFPTALRRPAVASESTHAAVSDLGLSAAGRQGPPPFLIDRHTLWGAAARWGRLYVCRPQATGARVHPPRGPPGTARHILRGQPAPLGFVRCASGAFFPAQLRLVPALTMIGHKIPGALRGVAHPATSRVAKSERRADQSAVVPVVWTGSGKNKLRPVAG